MGFFQDIGQFGEQIIDTAEDFVESIGTNLTASADQRAVNVQAQELQIQIAAQKFKNDQKRKDQLQQVFVYGIVFLLLLLGVIVGANVYKKLNK
jgi:hypothetical protein